MRFTKGGVRFEVIAFEPDHVSVQCIDHEPITAQEFKRYMGGNLHLYGKFLNAPISEASETPELVGNRLYRFTGKRPRDK